eukprot:6260841-Amphidinium_carterae.1
MRMVLELWGGGGGTILGSYCPLLCLLLTGLGELGNRREWITAALDEALQLHAKEPVKHLSWISATPAPKMGIK